MEPKQLSPMASVRLAGSRLAPAMAAAAEAALSKISAFGPAASSLRLLEGIEHRHVEVCEVGGISRDDCEPVRRGGRRDHRVLVEGVGPAVEEPRPGAKCRAVHGQNVVRAFDQLEPRLYFCSFGFILIARDLDAGLNLRQRDGGQMKIGVGDRPKPGNHAAVRARLSQFRDDVGVEQVHGDYRAATGLRLRALPRFGTCRSVRARSDSNSCLSDGRAAP